jgi:ferredoxin
VRVNKGPATELAVDWAACRAHGLCAELLPDHVTLDEWGYPILSGPLTKQAARRARSAVADCPALALRLRQVRPGED